MSAQPQPPSHMLVRSQDGINVVEFSDRKILEELSIREIEEQLAQIVAAQARVRMVLDFQNVEHLTSAALGMLINLEKKVNERQGKLALSNIKPQIFEVFKITRLHKLFNIHDTAAAALKSLQA